MLNFKIVAIILAMACGFVAGDALCGEDTKIGAAIQFQLPTEGPLPKTYRVTLAIVDSKNPDWIISQFVCGRVRTVTTENGGKFTETWDGLDDNFMPVPPGEYGVKGIFMPANKWDVDGEWHSVFPRFITSAEPWRAEPGENKVPVVVGDPCNSPLRDVDIGANGVGVFCYQYLENARNFYMADFKKPINYDQATPGYGSGGAAGGGSIATDGVTAWCCENEGFVFRTDGKHFGNADGRYRKGVYQPDGHVSAMAAYRDEGTGKSFLYLAERERLQKSNSYYAQKSSTDFVNSITVLDGVTATPLMKIPVTAPQGLVSRWGDTLWVLHKDEAGFVVSSVAMKAGLPGPSLKRVFSIPAEITPSDLEVDSHGRFYIADGKANKIYQFSPEGKPLRTFGKLPVQAPGKYDPESFMLPGKLACWRTADGADRLIVVEHQGTCRVTEWNPENGKLLREWMGAQTFANDGYAVDPRNPDRFYIRGHEGWLIRFRVDYESGQWHTEAVWPDVCTGRFNRDHIGFLRILYHGDTRYLAWSRGDFIYRESGDRWLPSAAMLTEGDGKERKTYFWNDANGDGQVQDDEYKPNLANRPVGTQRYWGDNWMDDFSLVAIQEGGTDVYRIEPKSFDAHGNPVFAADGWKKLLTDPVLEARKKGTATATFGGNEITDKFCSAWGMVAGSMKDGFYVNVRGPDLSANFGAQQKLSRYIPDGNGGYKLVWRVGRMAVHGTASDGEIYGAIHVMAPVGGLLTQVDQSRMGMLLYNEEGLYVDTLFPDERKLSTKKAGPYNLPGEFFTGYSFLNSTNEKIYLALGKTTPMLFEAVGWTGAGNPSRRLESVQKTVSIAASQIAPAPEFALALRKQHGGGTTARVAKFTPLMGGGPSLDGSMTGWEVCEPISFSGGEKSAVEVRCGYDPATFYLRWHVRLGRKFDTKALDPAERIFTHDREADTVSFYIQGDANAAPAKGRDARPGDTRFVFGVFKDKDRMKPVVLSMYPKWIGAAKGSALTYQTPAGGAASFEHVGVLESAKLGYEIDKDGEGFVIAAAIPRSAVPQLPPFTGEFRTQVNFDATFAGHNRFWWANADGTATRETYDEPTEARLYPGSWSQAQFEAVSNVPVRTFSAIGPFGFAKLPTLRHREDRNEICRTFATTAFPPESGIDLAASYTGDQARTRVAGRTLKWKTASISGDVIDWDTVLGWKGYEDEGSVYIATWIQSPQSQDIKLNVIEEHGHHAVRAWLNDQPLPSVNPKGQGPNDLHQSLDASKSVALKAGWNKLLIRYDLIWGANKLGITLDAPPSVLWTLKFSGTPPK